MYEVVIPCLIVPVLVLVLWEHVLQEVLKILSRLGLVIYLIWLVLEVEVTTPYTIIVVKLHLCGSLEVVLLPLKHFILIDFVRDFFSRKSKVRGALLFTNWYHR